MDKDKRWMNNNKQNCKGKQILLLIISQQKSFV